MTIAEKPKDKVAPCRSKDDNALEWQFVKDYGEFAMRMNFLACSALVEKARDETDRIKRKSLCLSGMQLLYSSLEDFSVLLHAMRRRTEGKHLHLSLGMEDHGQKGSTWLPQILKRYVSARQFLDELGLNKVTYKKVAKFIQITEQEFEGKYRTLVEDFKSLADLQSNVNSHKNKLKHGKPVFESEKNRGLPDHVVFLHWVWNEEGKQWVLEKRFVNASLEQLEAVLTNIGEIYIRTLELLWLYMMNYYPQNHEDFARNVMVPCINNCEGLRKEFGPVKNRVK